MSALITVTPEHKHVYPLVCNLGETTLIITSDYTSPDAFELAAPRRIDEATQKIAPDTPTTLILDPDETYNLYQCLHTLFHPTREQ